MAISVITIRYIVTSAVYIGLNDIDYIRTCRIFSSWISASEFSLQKRPAPKNGENSVTMSSRQIKIMIALNFGSWVLEFREHLWKYRKTVSVFVLNHSGSEPLKFWRKIISEFRIGNFLIGQRPFKETRKSSNLKSEPYKESSHQLATTHSERRVLILLNLIRLIG